MNPYADAGTVTNDVIMEQSSLVYDAAGTVIQTSDKQRYHNAPDTQKGALGSPLLTPNARATWRAASTDGAGRQIASANYGTNGGIALTRPATVPTRSDSILVMSTQYNDAGDRTSVFDPNNRETRFEFDAVARTTKLIENYQASGPVQPDVNRTTQTSYNADGNVATLTAWNSQTGNQTTNYTYRTTLTDSDLATSTLLQQVAYPDSVGGSDVVLLSYNRLGQRKQFTDQRGCAHSYVFDGLGRQIHDCVTAVGSGVDASIRRFSTQYDVRGLIMTMSSWDNATVGLGSVVNQVQNAYNDFAQLTQSWQAHAGTVVTGSTPQVQYSFASGSANTIRITGMTYPNGRNVVDDYGTAGSIDDACSRIRGMKDFGATANLVDYSYLGLSGFVKSVYPESSIQYTLIGTAGGTNLNRGTLNTGGTAITSPTFGQNWTLDETGNWSGFKQDDTGGGTWNLDQSRTANTVNEIETITNATSSAWTTPAYDAAGNMTRIPVPGTLPDGVAWNTMSLSEWDNLKLADWEELTLDNVEAVYDAWNRLVELHVGDTILAVYAYDARGYRIRKDSYTSGTLSEARHYYYTPGWQVVEERVGSSTAANRQFVWGLRYIDDLLLRDRDTDGNGTLDERRYCLQDGNWNTIAIANTSGTVTERFSYDAYGVPTFLTSGGTAQASSPTGWETLYAGYRWDKLSDSYQVRHRNYSAALGTWFSRDPAASRFTAKLYLYARCRPTVMRDPMGLQDLFPASTSVPTRPQRSSVLEAFLTGSPNPREDQPVRTRDPHEYMSPFGPTVACVPRYVNGRVVGSGGMAPQLKHLPPLLPGFDVAVEGHYDRNRFNYPPANQSAAERNGWVQQDANRSIYHQHGLPTPTNTKYKSPDGHQEAVFDANGQPVTDAANAGSYNYGPSGHGLSGDAHHVISDTIPYVVFGNSPDDPTPFLDRIYPGIDPGQRVRELIQAEERSAGLESESRCAGMDRFIRQPASSSSAPLRAGDWRRGDFGF